MADSPILNGWKEIAEYLKVHEQTAMKLAAEEKLPISKIGGTVFSTRGAIDLWVMENFYEKNGSCK